MMIPDELIEQLEKVKDGVIREPDQVRAILAEGQAWASKWFALQQLVSLATYSFVKGWPESLEVL